MKLLGRILGVLQVRVFGRMSDDDLRAIYRFLKTIPPVENEVGPPFVDKP